MLRLGVKCTGFVLCGSLSFLLVFDFALPSCVAVDVKGLEKRNKAAVAVLGIFLSCFGGVVI